MCIINHSDIIYARIRQVYGELFTRLFDDVDGFVVVMITGAPRPRLVIQL